MGVIFFTFPLTEATPYMQIKAMLLQQQSYTKRLDDSNGPSKSMAPPAQQSTAGMGQILSSFILCMLQMLPCPALISCEVPREQAVCAS